MPSDQATEVGLPPSITDEPVELRALALEGGMTLTIVGPAPGGESQVTASLPLQNRLEMISALGKGAMGEVWLARDAGLGRRVAYKHMLPEHATNPQLASRFFEEVLVTAQLDHPNILPIYNLEATPEGSPAYSMKLVQGRTLTAVLDDARVAMAKPGAVYRDMVSRHIETFLRICDGMAYAHSKRVLHRDLKPDNIMVGRFNEVYIMDWGICRVMGETSADYQSQSSFDQTAMVNLGGSSAPAGSQQRTQFGAIIGTPAYMSPEQALGQNATLDGRSDLYSLGLILQEMLSLRRARQAGSLNEMLRKAAQGDKTPAEGLGKAHRLPKDLEAIIGKATALRIEERYASVADLAVDLRRFLRGDAVEALPDTLMRKTLRYASRHGRLMVAGFVVVILLGAVSTMGVMLKAQRDRLELEVSRDALNSFIALGTRYQATIDQHLFRYNTALAQFAGRTIQTLEQPSDDVTVYTPADFDAGAVPGLALSVVYNMPVSTEAAAVLAPKGTALVEPDRMARALASLIHPLRNVIIRSSGRAPEEMDVTRIHEMITASTVPLLNAAVTLKNGLYVYFPGHGDIPADYDPLTRAKYTLAAHSTGIRWGAPYPDRYGRGLVLPASVALYSDEHQYLGVASVDIRFDLLVEPLRNATYPGYITETLLLDAEGRVMLRKTREPRHDGEPWADARDLSSAAGETAAQTLPAYADFARLITSDRDFGVADFRERGQFAGYYRLKTLGWYFVAVADREALLAGFREGILEVP